MSAAGGKGPDGSLPRLKTIALDLFSTFLEMHPSLRGLRGYTMMGNVYTEPAQQESRTQHSRAGGKGGESPSRPLSLCHD